MNISNEFHALKADEQFAVVGGGDKASLVVGGVVTVLGGITVIAGAPAAGVAIIGCGILYFIATAVY